MTAADARSAARAAVIAEREAIIGIIRATASERHPTSDAHRFSRLLLERIRRREGKEEELLPTLFNALPRSGEER